MGGNALKAISPARLTSLEVMNLYWRVNFHANLRGMTASLVPWVLSKTDHGDVDILLSSSSGVDLNHLPSALGVPPLPEYQFKNGDVLSLGVPVGDGRFAQVDLITVEQHALRHTILYYSGGGLGMLLGRIADHMGLVFAQEGLRLRKDPEKPWSQDILLTQYPYESLEALGFENGVGPGAFETEEQMWAWVMTSERASPGMFLPEATNHENRSRDKARPSWGRFIDWLIATYPNCEKEPRPVRLTHLGAQHIADRYYEGHFDNLRLAIIAQEKNWESTQADNREVGLGAVARYFPQLSPEQAGPIVRDMQPFLPNKEERKELLRMPTSRAALRALAEHAALLCGTRLGHNPEA